MIERTYRMHTVCICSNHEFSHIWSKDYLTHLLIHTYTHMNASARTIIANVKKRERKNEFPHKKPHQTLYLKKNDMQYDSMRFGCPHLPIAVSNVSPIRFCCCCRRRHCRRRSSHWHHRHCHRRCHSLLLPSRPSPERTIWTNRKAM